MGKIKIERQVDAGRLGQLDVESWGSWNKEISIFPWTYDVQETCYFLEGEVIVTPDQGEAITIGKGDLVTFPAGLSCTWEIRDDVEKHYDFG